MCTGDQSLPGGLSALIKQGGGGGGRGRKRGMDGGRDKEGGVHMWLKDESGREILASVMAVFGFDACSLCFSGLVAAEPNARATLRQPVMDIRGSRSARKWPKTQLALFTALFCQQQMSYVWSLTALNCAFKVT